MDIEAAARAKRLSEKGVSFKTGRIVDIYTGYYGMD